METFNKILWNAGITIIWLISSFVTIIIFIHYGYNIKYEDILIILSSFNLNAESYIVYTVFLIEFLIVIKILK